MPTDTDTDTDVVHCIIPVQCIHYNIVSISTEYLVVPLSALVVPLL